MSELTKQEKLEIIQEVRERFRLFRVPCLCLYFKYSVRQRFSISCVAVPDIFNLYFPELVKLKPKGTHWGIPWWDSDDIESRLKFLDDLEKMVNESN